MRQIMRCRQRMSSWLLFLELISLFRGCVTLRGGPIVSHRIHGSVSFAVIPRHSMALSMASRAMESTSTTVATPPSISNKNSTVYSVRLTSPNSARRKHTLYSVHAERWNTRFDELVEFRNKYGNTHVPRKPTRKIPHDYSELASFCRNVRQQYRYLHDEETRHLSFLTKDRIERLDSIGFAWDVQYEKWLSRYEELVEFYEKYGHTNVKQTDRHNPKLGSWVSYQRIRYKKNEADDDSTDRHPDGIRPLTARQIQLLEDLGFQWDPKDEVWWYMYGELKAFMAKHGHAKVPTNYSQCPRLNPWLTTLRKYCREYVLSVTLDGTTEGVHVSGLTAERLQALRDIDFCWLPQTEGPLTETPPNDIFDRS